MGLLSPEDYNAFRSAIKQVTDTFNKVPVKVIVRTDNVALLNQSRASTSTETEYNINALAIHESDGTKAQAEQIEAGAYDMSEGYILLNFEDADSAGLIEAGPPGYNPIIEPNRDTLEFYGKKFEILGVNLVGPVEEKYSLVKINFKNRSHGQK